MLFSVASDMAQPIIVAGATTESCAAVGPVQNHGVRSYSRMAGTVKMLAGRYAFAGDFTKILGMIRSVTGLAQNSR